MDHHEYQLRNYYTIRNYDITATTIITTGRWLPWILNFLVIMSAVRNKQGKKQKNFIVLWKEEEIMTAKFTTIVWRKESEKLNNHDIDDDVYKLF